MALAMSRRAIPAVVLVPLLVVALVVSTSACGTIANFNGGHVPLSLPTDPAPPPVAYGGVQWDIESAIKSKADVGTKALIFPLWLLDLTLSATFDTATLPIVFWINARRAWDRGSDNPTFPDVARPASGEPKPRGWYPDPYKPTAAERVLTPPPVADDEAEE
jgi:hypothetical protein